MSQNILGCSAVWLARMIWDHEVAGSNPVIPTIKHWKVAQLVVASDCSCISIRSAPNEEIHVQIMSTRPNQRVVGSSPTFPGFIKCTTSTWYELVNTNGTLKLNIEVNPWKNLYLNNLMKYI